MRRRSVMGSAKNTRFPRLSPTCARIQLGLRSLPPEIGTACRKDTVPRVIVGRAIGLPFASTLAESAPAALADTLPPWALGSGRKLGPVPGLRPAPRRSRDFERSIVPSGRREGPVGRFDL